ncbi:hypothetical protein [Georgenia faecalis]|uniref:Uncharacterized protein n=1 Tax=Georgenia faecalis TaxID=2483799 RepID=A0ABV9D7D0_9MICO|nr:hypothetical protein [Georgenia faecalis]
MTLLDDVAVFRRVAAGGAGIVPPATGTGHPVATASTDADGLLTLDLAEPVDLAALAAALGPARALPTNPAGGRALVLFGETLPDEGERGVTVLAEVDGETAVRLLLRPDAFPPEPHG